MPDGRENARVQTPARPVALCAARGGTRFNHGDTEAQLEVIIPQAAPPRAICLNSGLEPAAEAIRVLGRGDEGFHHGLAGPETVAVKVRVRAGVGVAAEVACARFWQHKQKFK